MSIEDICNEVLERINPSNSEQKQLLKMSEKLIEEIEKIASRFSFSIKVRMEGSVAKNTWLKDSPEIDIFMKVPTNISREVFEKTCLDIAKKATEGYEQIERFAEHPYLEVIMNGINVNIVPCYDVKQGEWISATDRTPFHTDFIKINLNKQMEKEARLLKRFMKGIGSYGAEIKVGGFSGYLCELLILSYGSFLKVLKHASNWNEGTIIDYKKYYKTIEDLQKKFSSPLTMIDPIDKGRNVAAAVRKEKLFEFIAASREFLKKCDLKFFYPENIEPLKSSELINSLNDRGSTIIFIKFNGVTVPDILWGQLYKSLKALRRMILRQDFRIFRDTVWSNEKNLNVFVIEVENRFLPKIKHHMGPPLNSKVNCDEFLQMHSDVDSTISGPRIEDDRWIVDKKRKYWDVIELLNEKLRDGGRDEGVADFVSKCFLDSIEILVNKDILKMYSTCDDFAGFFTNYLEGKPSWL